MDRYGDMAGSSAISDCFRQFVEFEVSGDKMEAVHMIPGWTHNIINLSDTENLVTVMTCNEIFNPSYPDTFFEAVEEEKKNG